ncbi:hypothetical protein AB9E09_35365, partial [Rhizobium leguminosarum]|uniref:hypothetical protein n=1 Tax=Rhizobium leguminosarum TaxID=384 RepID=UPI003F97367E
LRQGRISFADIRCLPGDCPVFTVLAVPDFVLMMQDGSMIAFGPKEEVLARVSRPEAARTPIAERVAQLKVVVDGMN